MNPRICICCGDRIPESGKALSRNPNMCASCSSLADGMWEEEERAEGPVHDQPSASGDLPWTSEPPGETHEVKVEAGGWPGNLEG
jgi:hypothetical protein